MLLLAHLGSGLGFIHIHWLICFNQQVVFVQLKDVTKKFKTSFKKKTEKTNSKQNYPSPGTLLLWQLLICGSFGGLGTPLRRQYGEVECFLVQAEWDQTTCRDWSTYPLNVYHSETRVQEGLVKGNQWLGLVSWRRYLREG